MSKTPNNHETHIIRGTNKNHETEFSLDSGESQYFGSNRLKGFLKKDQSPLGSSDSSPFDTVHVVNEKRMRIPNDVKSINSNYYLHEEQSRPNNPVFQTKPLTALRRLAGWFLSKLPLSELDLGDFFYSSSYFADRKKTLTHTGSEIYGCNGNPLMQQSFFVKDVSDQLLIMCIMVTYVPFQPLIVLSGFLYFFFANILYTYLYIFYYTSGGDSGGDLFSAYYKRVGWTIMLQSILLGIYMTSRNSFIPGSITICSALLVLLYVNYLIRTLTCRSKLNLYECSTLDLDANQSEIMKNNKIVTSNIYAQPGHRSQLIRWQDIFRMAEAYAETWVLYATKIKSITSKAKPS